MIDTILIDMDGVLADFVGALLRASSYTLGDYKKGVRNIFEAVQLHQPTVEEQYFKDPDFWYNLPKTSEADVIVAACTRSKRKVALLTDPSVWEAAFKGKRLWVERHFPGLPIIFIKHKHFCSSHNSLLIDDWSFHVEAFRAEGGAGVLVPRRWNEEHELADDCEQIVLRRIRGALG